MKANDLQIGGEHYRSEMQHWDVVEKYGIGYLEGCSSKYLLRWKKKNGLEDLQKSLHYAVKLRELHVFNARGPRGYVPDMVLQEFIEVNAIEPEEAAAISVLFQWKTEADLLEASEIIQRIIDRER